MYVCNVCIAGFCWRANKRVSLAGVSGKLAAVVVTLDVDTPHTW